MKWNCFDWFDHYAAEKNGVPKLETQPIHTDAIWKRVQEQAGIAPQPKRNRMHMTKWVAGIAAAAVLVTGGTTLVAAAGYGGLDAFFQSLIGEETPKDPEKLAALVTTPAAEFDSTNEDVQFKLLGMYGDDNYALLSFQLTAADGISLDGKMLPYTVYIDGVLQDLGEMGDAVTVRERNGAYYCNLLIDHIGLRGKALDLTFQNLYTQEQYDKVYQQVTDYENELQQDYIRQLWGEDVLNSLEKDTLPENFDVEAWKAYRIAHGYPQKISEKLQEAYMQSEREASGSWHTSMTLDFANTDQITADFSGGSVTLQPLSASLTIPEEWTAESSYINCVITLKDGRKVYSDYYEGDYSNPNDTDNLLRGIHALPDCENDTLEQYLPIAQAFVESDATRGTQTQILCYGEPIEPTEVAAVTLYRFAYRGENALGTSGVQGYDLTDTMVPLSGIVLSDGTSRKDV